MAISFCAASAFLTMSASSLVRLNRAVRCSPCCLRHLLAKRLLLGPKLLELRNCVATRLVCSDQVVHQRLRLAAGALGRPYPVWIEAEHLDINHRASLTTR